MSYLQQRIREAWKNEANTGDWAAGHLRQALAAVADRPDGVCPNVHSGPDRDGGPNALVSVASTDTGEPAHRCTATQFTQPAGDGSGRHGLGARWRILDGNRFRPGRDGTANAQG